MLTFLALAGSPRERGEQHGESLRGDIIDLVGIRWELLRKRSAIRSQAALQELAQAQWDYTATAWQALADELDGIAAGAGVSRVDLVVLNNYTDFRDILPSTEGCTAVYVASGGRQFVGQTWDMHASAERFVVGLAWDDAVLLSVAGCLGMMGLNRHGAAVVVNNFVSSDAQAGVIWPAVVRSMLTRPTRAAMAEELKAARLTSGHNYLLADPAGAENWETSGQRKQRTWASTDDGYFFHTNHYLDFSMRDCEGTRATTSTTFERYNRIEQLVSAGGQSLSVGDIVGWLSDHDGAPRSICSHLGTDDPDASKTCGGVVVSPGSRQLTAWQGCLQTAGNAVVERTLVGVPDVV